MCGFVCAPFQVVFKNVLVFHVCAFSFFRVILATKLRRNVRKHILEKNLPAKLIGECLQLLQTDGTWKTLEEFTMCLAALTTCYPHEASRRSDKKSKTLASTLHAACSPQRFAWYLNNVALHHGIAEYASALLPSGTTGNEALHAELNAIFRQQYKLQSTTLRLKLSVFSLAKQVAHQSATRTPMSHQERQQEVLAFTLARALLCRKQWQAWCPDGQTSSPLKKAKLEGLRLREQHVARVRAWLAKHHLALHRRLKRTVSTRRRCHSMLTKMTREG